MSDLDSHMERLKALHAQRKETAAELDRIDVEIRTVASLIAGASPAAITAAVTRAAFAGARENGTVRLSRTKDLAGTNGVGDASPGHPRLESAAPHRVTPQGLTASATRELAPRKLELLRFLRAHPKGDPEYFARKMYGNSSRHARVNVSSYFSDLKADGYVEPGASAGTFSLTAKGYDVTETLGHTEGATA